MKEYGIITNGILIKKKSMTPGYKPIKYGVIPEDFYEDLSDPCPEEDPLEAVLLRSLLREQQR